MTVYIQINSLALNITHNQSDIGMIFQCMPFISAVAINSYIHCCASLYVFYLLDLSTCIYFVKWSQSLKRGYVLKSNVVLISTYVHQQNELLVS